MTTLLFVRHGESRANKYHLYTGQTHIPLSELGKAQATLTGKYIAKKYKVDKIYSSDLIRAYDTACSISEALGMLPVYSHPDLREIYAGSWEGARNTQLESICAEAFDKWKNDVANCHCPDGETVAELADRFYKKVLEIAAENDGKTVVIASHATPIRAITTIAMYGSIEKMADIPWATNASVTVIEVENGKLTLKEASIDSHLGVLSTALWKD
ncbi:MAG: histidine phosphatase family protein [Clostridia bacterium]|nr:histidine phosphatase family protein [Clostridia bacterium]